MNIPRLMLVAAIVGAGIGSTHAMDFPANHALADARLDTIRGGYDLGDNLRASFALERTVLVNGVEAIRQSVKIPDVAQISIDQANALRNALGTVVVSNGTDGIAAASMPSVAPAVASNAPSSSAPVSIPVTGTAATLPTGLAVATSTLPTNSAGLIVQNSVNDTSIMATTKIDAAVNTSAMLQNMRIDESIRDAVIQFRGN